MLGTENSGMQPGQLNPALRKLQPQKGKVKMGFTAEMQTQYDEGRQSALHNIPVILSKQ